MEKFYIKAASFCVNEVIEHDQQFKPHPTIWARIYQMQTERTWEAGKHPRPLPASPVPLDT